MTNYDVFDIALLPFPFTNLNTKKQRPALILKKVASKSFGALFICAMITSQIEGESIEGDLLFKDWQSSGLLHPSKLRLAKVVTVEESLLQKKLGELAVADQKNVKSMLQKFFKI